MMKHGVCNDDESHIQDDMAAKIRTITVPINKFEMTTKDSKEKNLYILSSIPQGEVEYLCNLKPKIQFCHPSPQTLT